MVPSHVERYYYLQTASPFRSRPIRNNNNNNSNNSNSPIYPPVIVLVKYIRQKLFQSTNKDINLGTFKEQQ